MRKGDKQVFVTLGFLGLLFLMPFSGNGADLTVSDVITGNGNMTLNGAMSATSFSGSGSGLTNLSPAQLSSGTANINISGNAATVTNGIYSSGSYADPSWITSLSPSKLTSGTANINISGNAATVTNGVYSSGSYADPSWITSLSPSKLISGTANINISGNAATATTATTATTANSVVVNGVFPVNIAFYGNVAVVAPSGGDYTNPATAMGAYNSWCGTPSATNPCLLKIMPGVYDIGTSTVVMQPYIDIEGSGQNVTVITGTVSSGSLPSTNGVVNGANNAEIRFLTVKNTGSGTYVAAILNSSASPTMSNVTATASGGTFDNYGVYNSSSSPTMSNVTATASGGTGSANYGVYNSSSSPTMSNVTATASGGTGSANYGVYNSSSSSPTMTNVTATGKDGTNNFGLSVGGGSTPLIDRSTFDGSTNSISNASGSTVNIGASKLVSAAKGGAGTYNCVGVYKYIGGTLSSADGSCN